MIKAHVFPPALGRRRGAGCTEAGVIGRPCIDGHYRGGTACPNGPGVRPLPD
jgi:hypothetical protein